jgi:hypothetical protein
MPGVEQTVRRWLRETHLETADIAAPNTNFSVGFKYPSGIQLVAAQPKGRNDMVVVSCGLTIDTASKKSLKSHARDFVWNLRRDLLLSKLNFQLAPADADVPDTVGISVELYQDGLNKNVFMRGAQDVHSGAILVILITRKFVETPSD